jgi:hypothetical protein
MFKLRIYLTPVLASLFLSTMSQSVMAVLLDGTLLIDPGIKGPVEVIRADGSIVYRDKYLGGSYFGLGTSNPNSSNAVMLTPGTAGGIQLGTYQNFVTNPDIPHPQGWKGDTNGDGIDEGAAGAGYSRQVVEGTAFSSFKFFSNDTYIGLNPVSYQSAIAAPAPTVNLDMTTCANNLCSITADFTAWEVFWNGSVFQQGPRPVNSGPFGVATGSYDLLTKRYSLGWTSQINGGPFNGVTGTWYIEGELAPVPVPAAFWLFGSGLLGLIGIIRRKKIA